MKLYKVGAYLLFTCSALMLIIGLISLVITIVTNIRMTMAVLSFGIIFSILIMYLAYLMEQIQIKKAQIKGKNKNTFKI